MSLAADYAASPEDLARAMQGRCYALSVPYTLAGRDGTVPTLDALAREVVRRVLAPAGLRPELELALEPLPLGLRLASALSLWLHEVVSNATSHALGSLPRPRLVLASRRDEQQMVLTVVDNGPGLPPGFDPARDASMGLTVARAVASHDLGGSMELKALDPGLEVRLFIPHSELEALNREAWS